MKITKQYLNQIIKEETEKILSESFRKAFKAAKEAGENTFRYKGKLYGTKMSTKSNWKKRQARRRKRNLEKISAVTGVPYEEVKLAHANDSNKEVAKFGKLARLPARMSSEKFRQLPRSKGGRPEVKPTGAPQDSAEVKAIQKKLARTKQSKRDPNRIRIPKARGGNINITLPRPRAKYDELAPENTAAARRQRAREYLKRAADAAIKGPKPEQPKKVAPAVKPAPGQSN